MFQHAKAVFAWLGTAAKGTAAVFAAFNKLKDRSPDLPRNPTLDDIASIVLSPRTDDRYKVLAPKLYESIVDIAQRDWFERLWIAQEYISARSVVFFCGNVSLDAQALIQALQKVSVWSFGGVLPDSATRGITEHLR